MWMGAEGEGRCKNVARLLGNSSPRFFVTQPQPPTISQKIIKIRDGKGVSSHIDVINWDTDTAMETKDMKFPIYIQIWNFLSLRPDETRFRPDGWNNFYAYFTFETLQTLVSCGGGQMEAWLAGIKRVLRFGIFRWLSLCGDQFGRGFTFMIFKFMPRDTNFPFSARMLTHIWTFSLSAFKNSKNINFWFQ